MKTQDLNGVRVTFIRTLIKFPTSRNYLEAYYSLEHQYSEWLVRFSIPHTVLNKLSGQLA